MTAKVICVATQKGGAGKTTTAHALAGELWKRGKRVLGVDVDQQADYAVAIGADTLEEEQNAPTVWDVLQGKIPAAAAIIKTLEADAIIGTPQLAKADRELDSEYVLRDVLQPIKDDYDYIIIDVPPSLGILTVNALTAADYVVIPAQVDVFALRGIRHIAGTINAVKKAANTKLTVTGVLLVMSEQRTIFSRDFGSVIEELTKELDTRLYAARIRESIVIKEAHARYMSPAGYAPASKVARDYAAFTDELLKRIKQAEKGRKV